MRKIKFRAWNKIGRRMMPNSEISRDTDGNWFVWDDNDDPQDTGFVLMQYTGLKDKNGKEIYEGDICKAPHDFGPAGWVERTFTVHWDNERGYQWSYWKLDELEIIGNIYENPKLLK